MSALDTINFLERYGQGIKQAIPNQYLTKPVIYWFSDVGVAKFNEIYQFLKASNLHNLERTRSGAIGTGAQYPHNHYAWDCVQSASGARITARLCGITYVFRLGSIRETDNTAIAPWRAWATFVEELEADGINIDDYIIDNGLEVKETIPPPPIVMKRHMLETDKGLTNVHHIDYHSSYPAGLMLTHPEFEKTIRRLYRERKTNPEYKAVLNFSIGAMQSPKNPWRARWAHLSRDAITNNNERIGDLIMRLITTGRELVGINTDGVWYRGEVFHDSDEGMDIGQWSNDHINTTFRARSNGAYEYLEDGQYHVVLRGACKLDGIKDRKDWQWGDIYRADATIIEYTWDDAIGVVKEA